MPCYDSTPEEDRRQAWDLIDTLTRLLCTACRKLEGAEIPMGAPLSNWWANHQKADAERKAEEKRFATARVERAKRELAEAKKGARVGAQVRRRK